MKYIPFLPQEFPLLDIATSTTIGMTVARGANTFESYSTSVRQYSERRQTIPCPYTRALSRTDCTSASHWLRICVCVSGERVKTTQRSGACTVALGLIVGVEPQVSSGCSVPLSPPRYNYSLPRRATDPHHPPPASLSAGIGEGREGDRRSLICACADTNSTNCKDDR